MSSVLKYGMWLYCRMIMEAEINFSSTFSLYKAMTLFCLNARNPLSVYEKPEDILAGLHS